MTPPREATAGISWFTQEPTATAVVAWGFIGISSALAQSGNLDMDVNPDAHVAGVPAAEYPRCQRPRCRHAPRPRPLHPKGRQLLSLRPVQPTEQADAPVSAQPDSAEARTAAFSRRPHLQLRSRSAWIIRRSSIRPS